MKLISQKMFLIISLLVTGSLVISKEKIITAADLSFRQSNILKRIFDDLSKSKTKLQDIFVIDFKTRLTDFETQKVSNGMYLYGGGEKSQVIVASSNIGKKLIELSNINGQQAEQMTIIGFTQDGGVIHFDDYHTSGKPRTIEPKVINEAFGTFYKKASKAGLIEKIQHVEVIHSHPLYEASHTSGKIYYQIHGDYNAGDIRLARQMSLDLQRPLLFTVSLPNGYSYTAVFINGINVTIESLDVIKSHFEYYKY